MKSYKLVSILVVLGIFLLAQLAASSPAEARKKSSGKTSAKPKAALVSLDYGKDADVDLVDEVYVILASSMSKFDGAKVVNQDAFDAEIGKKTGRQISKCGYDEDCVFKRSRKVKGYDLLIIGKAEADKKNGMEFSFKVLNLKQQENKRTKKFSLEIPSDTGKKGKKGKKPAPKGPFFTDDEAKRWTKELMTPVKELMEEEEEEEEQEERAKPRRGDSSRGRYNEGYVKSGIKAAYKEFVSGNINKAKEQINDVRRKRCECDADRLATDFKLMFDAFATANDKVKDSFRKGDGAAIIASLEEMKTMESELSREGKNLGLTDASKYARDLNDQYAKAYRLMAGGYLKQYMIVEARDAYESCLKVVPKDAECQKGLSEIPSHIEKLFRLGRTKADYAPKEAYKIFMQAKELTEEDTPLAKQINAAIKELIELNPEDFKKMAKEQPKKKETKKQQDEDDDDDDDDEEDEDE